MKIGLGPAFILAVLFHGALLATLAVNVSLDRPKKPEEKPGQIMHATIVSVPPAKGNPEGEPPRSSMQDTTNQAAATAAALAKAKAEAEARAKAEAEAKAKAELAKQVEAQKKAEAERQKALALKKAAEEKLKKEAEAKAKAEAEARAKAEAEAKAKAEAEAKAQAEAKAKAEAEARAKAEAEAKAKAAAEAKAKAEAEAKAKAEAKARAEAARKQAEQEAADFEKDLLGQANGLEGGVGAGSGTTSNSSVIYGGKVQQLIEQNWRIDPSMNGKRVVVTVSVDNSGMIFNEKCKGDLQVCNSALSTLKLIGMLPMPPKDCKDCNTIVITMTPKI